jgi:hypothetical protein
MKLTFLLLVGLLIAPHCLHAQADESKQSDLQILQDKKLRISDPKMVVDAIEREKSSPDSSTAELIPALVDLLDFERPKSSGRIISNLNGVPLDVIVDTPTSYTYYPAVWALIALKDESLPAWSRFCNVRKRTARSIAMR